jgi:hypothetical protein
MKNLVEKRRYVIEEYKAGTGIFIHWSYHYLSNGRWLNNVKAWETLWKALLVFVVKILS